MFFVGALSRMWLGDIPCSSVGDMMAPRLLQTTSQDLQWFPKEKYPSLYRRYQLDPAHTSDIYWSLLCNSGSTFILHSGLGQPTSFLSHHFQSHLLLCYFVLIGVLRGGGSHAKSSWVRLADTIETKAHAGSVILLYRLKESLSKPSP